MVYKTSYVPLPPPASPHASGREFAYTIHPQPACERITLRFRGLPGTTLDFYAEVQTLCFNETAIRLHNLEAIPTQNRLPAVGLAGLGLVGTAVVITRRQRKA